MMIILGQWFFKLLPNQTWAAKLAAKAWFDKIQEPLTQDNPHWFRVPTCSECYGLNSIVFFSLKAKIVEENGFMFAYVWKCGMLFLYMTVKKEALVK